LAGIILPQLPRRALLTDPGVAEPITASTPTSIPPGAA
jgi:hypothetical protein